MVKYEIINVCIWNISMIDETNEWLFAKKNSWSPTMRYDSL